VALTAIAAALLFRADSWIAAWPGLSRSGPGGYFGVAFGQSVFRALGKPSGLVTLLAWLTVLQFVADGPFVRARLWIASLFPRRSEDGDTATEDAEVEVETETESEEPEPRAQAEEESDDEDEDDADEDGAAAPRAPKATKTRVPTGRPPPVPPAPKLPARVRPPVPEDYVWPGLDLLEPGIPHDPETVREEVEANGRVLAETLASFEVEAKVVSHLRGPVITFYEIAIPAGVRLNRVTALADDLAIGLKAPSIRIVAPIPGRNTVGIEVPNLQRDPVVLHDVMRDAQGLVDRMALPLFLGRDTAGRLISEDLASMPHLLIAGSTGSGKSVCVNSILLSVLYTRTPAEVRLILIDPKQVELSFFEGIPHLLTPVVTDMQKAAKILEWAVERMEERYGLLLACGVRNVAGYNAVTKEKRKEIRERDNLTEEDLPDHLAHLVIVVDELADLMMVSGKDVELAITRLAQKSRAVGIHIILATQRPSTDVITGLIKANMPTRIAFRVASKIDSRVILDANGADKLLGKGDMLYMNPGSMHLRRAQGTLVTDNEARAVVDFLKAKGPAPAYEDILKSSAGVMGDPMEEDDLYNDAVRAVLAQQLGSASLLQRRLGIGYTRASRLIDMMSDRGIVGPHVGSKAREVLFTLEEWDKQHGTAGATLPAGGGAPEDPADRCVDESWE
jgi:S-DNA-T family DNA segregation ATPase FtsK/SpoIIIE